MHATKISLLEIYDTAKFVKIFVLLWIADYWIFALIPGETCPLLGLFQSIAGRDMVMPTMRASETIEVGLLCGPLCGGLDGG